MVTIDEVVLSASCNIQIYGQVTHSIDTLVMQMLIV